LRVFERPGPVNTSEVVEIVKSSCSEVDYIVVASVTGASAVKIAEKVTNKKIVCVTCPQGMYWQVNQMDDSLFTAIPELKQQQDSWLKQGLEKVPMYLTEENKAKLKKLKVEVIRGTIPLFGPTFSMRLHLQKPTTLDVMAKTLELISTGSLVCMETVLMTTDAGVIPEEKLVLACAGTEMGLDTAWTVRSSASANLFPPTKGFRFVELLAKPKIAQIPDTKIKYIR
jgi:hypothetical protein